MKDELDIHLDSINQNTNEIQTTYENVAELESKIEKLSEKLDEIQMQLNPAIKEYNFENLQLSEREKEMFLNIYTEEDRVSILILARKCSLTLEMCDSLINKLMSKGIPIMKQFVNEKLFISLEYTFKDLQARKNILGLDAPVSRIF